MPFGYRIENGAAVIDSGKARQIRNIYAGYLSGQSYISAAKNAGLEMSHASVKRMLQNRHYLGDDFYPQIIDRDTFEAAEKERLKRLEIMGRNKFHPKAMERHKIPCHFMIRNIAEEKEDPYAHAAYIYSLIESEE